MGLGANLLEDAIYPLDLAHETGKPLGGSSDYVLHFDGGATPLSTPSGRSPSMTMMAFRSRIRSTASRSAVGCR
jgi:hypothetical protein